ncbi:hypothetical protein FDECE_10263 [Fusarium decemcellulare]|nr:hypothetical protein FDECE_10263 [Fusarium decemcellulare]
MSDPNEADWWSSEADEEPPGLANGKRLFVDLVLDSHQHPPQAERRGSVLIGQDEPSTPVGTLCGPCVYSRDQSPPKRKAARTETPTTDSALIRDIDERLRNVEQTIQNLSSAVDRILEAVTPANLTDGSNAAVKGDKTLTSSAIESQKEPGLYLGPSNSFSFLGETPANIDAVARPSTPLDHQNAMSELQYLSTSLRTAVISKQDTKDGFYIPSKAVGYQLIGRFLEHAVLGETFFTTPSDKLLMQVVFDPENVRQKAWVVYVNYMMLALVSVEEQDQSVQADQFRQNMRLALNDSSIFLEPRETNVQALAVLAVHGEDYASPNLSWMLVGHACRQAEALGLHAPTDSDFVSHQRTLSLFWLLFAVDKSCSLAFGRSSFLPSASYSSVPLPDFGYLVRFQPHNDSPFGNRQTAKLSTFGAHIFIARMELAKLIGSVLDLRTPGHSSPSKEELVAQLDTWYQRAIRILAETMNSESASLGPNQAREMTLGISSVKFEYLHLLILLHKGDPSCALIRLESAREAIALLPTMVSNWASVYNGVIWHLLYYPFIPFFVVFEHLVHDQTHSNSAQNQQDIDLLSTTVSYYATTVFLGLVQLHMDRPAPVHPTVRASAHNERDKRFQESNVMADNIQRIEHDLGDGLGMDMESFLDWLPADIFPVFNEEQHGPLQTTSDAILHGNASQQCSRGRKRSFDSLFDWFSWDAYYADAEPQE